MIKTDFLKTMQEVNHITDEQMLKATGLKHMETLWRQLETMTIRADKAMNLFNLLRMSAAEINYACGDKAWIR